MANIKTLIPAKKGEIRNPQGKPIGTLNRGTTLKKWLSVKVEAINPETNEPIIVTQADAIALALIKKACEGDIPAIKEIQDTLYGKIKDVSEIMEVNKVDLSSISTEELIKRVDALQIIERSKK